MEIPCIAIGIGIALIILFMISFAYGKKHLAPIKIRTSDIAPYDSWVIMSSNHIHVSVCKFGN